MEREIVIGGEESGGIGYSRFLPERDGLLNSLLLANVMAEEGKPLGQLVADLQKEYGPHYYGRRDLHISEEDKAERDSTSEERTNQTLGKLFRPEKRESRRHQVFPRRSHQRQRRGSLDSVSRLRHRAATAHLCRGRLARTGERNPGQRREICKDHVVGVQNPKTQNPKTPYVFINHFQFQSINIL